MIKGHEVCEGCGNKKCKADPKKSCGLPQEHDNGVRARRLAKAQSETNNPEWQRKVGVKTMNKDETEDQVQGTEIELEDVNEEEMPEAPEPQEGDPVELTPEAAAQLADVEDEAEQEEGQMTLEGEVAEEPVYHPRITDTAIKHKFEIGSMKVAINVSGRKVDAEVFKELCEEFAERVQEEMM